MRRIPRTTALLAAAALLALPACSSRSSGGGGGAAQPSTGSSGSAAPSASTGAGSGGGNGATIGVALPSKTSENWVLAGNLFTADIKAAGYKPDVQYASASGTVADQQGQITSMITKGAKVIIIGAADGGQLVTQVNAAHDAGIKVIAYDRLILNTPNLDYYVAYDNFKVGQLQGQALIEGMKKRKPNGPYNIELFAGSPDDNNSHVFFDGAMSVLKPLIANGTLKVGSGQKDFKQVTTDGWKAENAQRRMDTIMTSTYSGAKTLDGVLSPNDTLARAIITSVKGAGKPVPVVTGQDSEVESVKLVRDGVQYSTINKDTRNLVKAATQMAADLIQGKTATVNDTKSYNNGVKVVPTYLLPPLLVTKDNIKTAYANDPKLNPIANGANG